MQVDLQYNSQEIKQLMLNSFVDRTFNAGIIIAKLRSWLVLLSDHITRVENLVQQAQHNQLSTSYLSFKNLLDLFQQVQGQAKRFGYRTIIDRTSKLFQLDASYTFDGNLLSLLLHVPIAPPDTFM